MGIGKQRRQRTFGGGKDLVPGAAQFVLPAPRADPQLQVKKGVLRHPVGDGDMICAKGADADAAQFEKACRGHCPMKAIDQRRQVGLLFKVR